MEERIPGYEYTIKEIGTSEKILNLKKSDIKHQKIWDIMKRPEL